MGSLGGVGNERAFRQQLEGIDHTLPAMRPTAGMKPVFRADVFFIAAISIGARGHRQTLAEFAGRAPATATPSLPVQHDRPRFAQPEHTPGCAKRGLFFKTPLVVVKQNPAAQVAMQVVPLPKIGTSPRSARKC